MILHCQLYHTDIIKTALLHLSPRMLRVDWLTDADIESMEYIIKQNLTASQLDTQSL